MDYTIHRAIDRPVIFKGFQAQYILAAALSLIADLLLFVILYCCRLNPWACTIIAVGLGAVALVSIGRLSRKYGVHGLMKLRARRKIPQTLSFPSRYPFIQLNKSVCFLNQIQAFPSSK